MNQQTLKIVLIASALGMIATTAAVLVHEKHKHDEGSAEGRKTDKTEAEEPEEKQSDVANRVHTFGKGVIDKNTCCIAADGAENVYVANQRDARVRKFDRSGTLVWTLELGDGKSSIDSIGAADKGSIWLSAGHALFEHASDDGKPLKTIPMNRGSMRAREIAVDALGNLVASHDRKALVFFDTSGKEQKRFPAVTTRGIGVDGQGNVAFADGDNEAIGVYDAEGKLKWHVGGKGDKRTEWPRQLTTDRRGRIFVHVFGRVNVFDPNGTLIGELPTSNGTDAIAISTTGVIFIVTDEEIARYEPAQKLR